MIEVMPVIKHSAKENFSNENIFCTVWKSEKTQTSKEKSVALNQEWVIKYRLMSNLHVNHIRKTE